MFFGMIFPTIILHYYNMPNEMRQRDFAWISLKSAKISRNAPRAFRAG
jgi:hypothetical protein